MKKVHLFFLLFGLIAVGSVSCGDDADSTDTTSADTTVDSAAEVAEVAAVSAGGLSQAGGNSAPDASASGLTVEDHFKYAIAGFTYDSETGSWAGTAQNGATPTLKFYRKDTGVQIAADPTEAASYQPGGDLFGLTPLDQANSQIQMEVTVAVAKTFTAGYTVTMTAVSSKVDGEPANIGTAASYAYTADSGTIVGDFGTITMSNISFTASDQGATVDGTYDLSVTIGSTTYTGTVTFDEGGCQGVTLRDGDGNTLGTAALNDSGQLIFTDANTNETTTLTRIES